MSYADKFCPGNNIAPEAVHNKAVEKYIAQVIQVGGLLTYDLLPEFTLHLDIESASIEGMALEADHSIDVQLIERSSGLLQVLADRASDDIWEGETINLGSAVFADGMLQTGGLLRGFIIPNATVVVDHKGTHFRDPSGVNYLSATYRSMSIDGIEVF